MGGGWVGGGLYCRSFRARFVGEGVFSTKVTTRTKGSGGKIGRYTSVYHQGMVVRGKLPSPMQSVKPETIYWLRMSKLSNLDSFTINKGETSIYMYMTIVRMNGDYSQAEESILPPPPQRKPWLV